MVTCAAGAQRKGNHGIALCTAAAGGGLSGPEKRVGELCGHPASRGRSSQQSLGGNSFVSSSLFLVYIERRDLL